MTTIVNNPPPQTTTSPDNSSGPFTAIIVLIIVLILAYLGFVYGARAFRQRQVVAPQVNIPSNVDVNIHRTQ